MILEELVSTLGLKINSAQWAAGEAAVSGMKKGLEGIAEKSGLSKLIKTGIGAFVGYEAISNVKEMISSVVELGGSLNDTAQKTGLSVEGLQYFGYVAKLNSSNMEEFADASTKLARGLQGIKSSADPAAQALHQIGINFSDPKFKNAEMDRKLEIIADHLSALPDGAKKTALAIDLFGRSGASLIPTLNDLGKNGNALYKEFQALGGGISTSNVAALDDFGDEIDKTKFSLTALKNTIVVAMLPTLKEWLHGIQEFIKNNKALIAQKAEQAFKAIANGLKQLAGVVRVVGELLLWMNNNGQQAIGIIAALVAYFAPWQLAVFAVVEVVKSLWDGFAEGKGPLAGFANWVKGVIDTLKREFQQLADTAEAVWDKVSAPFKAIGHGISAGVGAVQDFFGGDGSDNTAMQAFQSASPFAGSHTAPTLPSSDSSTPGAAPQQQFNTPITVHVNGGNPEETKAAVKSAVDEANKNMIRQALNAIGGKS